MKLILGLGNPGKKYEKNRHNLGVMALEALVKESGGAFKFCQRTLSLKALLQINGQKVILAQPQTFMNECGRAAARLLHYYKIKPADLWVIHDDLDLPLGKIRLKNKGSAGGHKGIASIIEHLKTQQFNRLKIGLGSNREKRMPAEKYVLQNFSPAELLKIKTAIKEAAEKLKNFVK
jgi:PTH1 family peptidyl-tRNA hydrolase